MSKLENSKLFDDVKKQVIYRNDFSEAVFENYTLKQKKLLLLLIAGLKNDEDKEYNFSPKEIKGFINMERQSYKEFSNIICELQKKPILILNKEKNELESISLFDKLVFKEKDKTIRVVFGNSAKKLFLSLTGNFSKYFIENISKLKNINSIEFYLKGESNLFKKKFDLNISELNRAFNTSYKKASELERSLIVPSLKDINTNTDIEINYEKIKEGKKIVGFNFDIIRKKVYSEKLETAIEQAKKNIHISRANILNINTIHQLLRKFSEKDLIIGLNYCYSKIKKDFSRLTYLENTIKTGLELEKENFKSVKKEKIEEKTKNIPLFFPQEDNQDLFNIWENLENLEEKLSIEKKALNNFFKETNSSESFLMEMRNSSYTTYINTIKKYIIELIKDEPVANSQKIKSEPVKKKRGRRKKLDMLDELDLNLEVQKNEKSILTFIKKQYGKEFLSNIINSDEKNELLKKYYVELLIFKDKNKK